MFDKDEFIKNYREGIILEEDRNRAWEKEYQKFIFCLAETVKYNSPNSIYKDYQIELIADLCKFMEETGYKWNTDLVYDLKRIKQNGGTFKIKLPSYWSFGSPSLWYETCIYRWPWRSPKYNLGEIPNGFHL